MPSGSVGTGIGMLPTYPLGYDLRAGRLIQLLPEYAPDVLDIHAIYLSRQHQPQALRLLVDFLTASFAGESALWDRHRLEANTLNTTPAQATGANQTSTLSTHPAFSASLAKLASKLFFASCFQVAASN